jgi:nuclear GTP-binding protein
MATGKKASKRTPLSRKYKIKHRAKEHERKLKKAAKKNPAMRKKLRKDLGIPNLNPFKQQILKRLEEQQKVIKFNELARQRRLQDAVSSERTLCGGAVPRPSI